MQAFTLAVPTATPEGALSVAQATAAPQQDSSRGAAATEQGSKAAPSASALSAPETGLLIPLPWVIGLGLLMIACGGAAWVVRRNNERRVRTQWNQT